MASDGADTYDGLIERIVDAKRDYRRATKVELTDRVAIEFVMTDALLVVAEILHAMALKQGADLSNLPIPAVDDD